MPQGRLISTLAPEKSWLVKGNDHNVILTKDWFGGWGSIWNKKEIFIFPNFRSYCIRMWYIDLLQPRFFHDVRKKQPILTRNMKSKPTSRWLLSCCNRLLFLGHFQCVFLLFVPNSVLYRWNFIMKVFRKIKHKLMTYWIINNYSVSPDKSHLKYIALFKY